MPLTCGDWLAMPVQCSSRITGTGTNFRTKPCRGSGGDVSAKAAREAEAVVQSEVSDRTAGGSATNAPICTCQIGLLTDSPGCILFLSRDKSKQDYGHDVLHWHEHCPSRAACLWTRFSEGKNQGRAQGDHLIEAGWLLLPWSQSIPATEHPCQRSRFR